MGFRCLTFDISGRRRAQPFDCPLDGRVRPHRWSTDYDNERYLTEAFRGDDADADADGLSCSGIFELLDSGTDALCACWEPGAEA